MSKIDFIMKSVSTSEFTEIHAVPDGDMHQKLTDAGHKDSGQVIAGREVFTINNRYISTPADEAIVYTRWIEPMGGTSDRLDITYDATMHEGDLEILEVTDDVDA